MKIKFIIFIISLIYVVSLRVEKNYPRTDSEISNMAAKILIEYSKSFSTNPDSKIILVNNEKATNSKILIYLENNYIANYIYLEDRSKNKDDDDSSKIYFKYK